MGKVVGHLTLLLNLDGEFQDIHIESFEFKKKAKPVEAVVCFMR